MPDSPAKIAAAVRAGVPSCSVVRLWGANLFWPGDVLYEVKGATAPDEHTLRIELYLAIDDSHVTIEVKDPEGWRVVDGALKVQRVTSLSWDGHLQTVGDPKAFALHLGH